jgi:aromatic ring-opening dioxygenase catalytic subunit (LigB family)
MRLCPPIEPIRNVWSDELVSSLGFQLEMCATTLRIEPAQRVARLKNWTAAPSARTCHPREEHLIPLMVAMGAAEGEEGRRVYSDAVMGCAVSGFEFGGEAGDGFSLI